MAAGPGRPDLDDVEERQLVNLVEEMALAAGVPSPRVLLVDADDANAAVVGRSVDDATLVVPRGLLTELGRAPTGAVVADMLAVVVNGDLRAAMVIASLYQALDVVGALLAAPARPADPPGAVAGAAAVPGRAGRHDGAAMQAVAEELAYVSPARGLDGTRDTNAALLLLTFPFMVANIAFTLVRFIVGGFVVSPVLAALWRRRRLLADATAVELTRNPDALARALDHLRRHGAVTPPGPWTHLGAVGPEGAGAGDGRHGAQAGGDLGRERRPTSHAAGRWPGACGRRKPPGTSCNATCRRSTGRPGRPAPRPGRRAGAGVVPPRWASGWPAWTRWARIFPTTRPRPGRPRPGAGGTTWSAGRSASPCWPYVFAVLMLALLGCLATFVYLALLFEAALLAPVVLVVNALVR